jgi:hypothetical protein
MGMVTAIALFWSNKPNPAAVNKKIDGSPTRTALQQNKNDRCLVLVPV